MPTNTFGKNDNYDLITSHFIPALIKKIHTAKINNKKFIVLLGNGKAKRELIYVDDLADAIIYFLNKKTKHSIINIGTGVDKTILDYAKIIFKISNYYPEIKFKRKNFNGTPRKLLDISIAKSYGWKPKTKIEKGLKETYEFYIKEQT